MYFLRAAALKYRLFIITYSLASLGGSELFHSDKSVPIILNCSAYRWDRRMSSTHVAVLTAFKGFITSRHLYLHQYKCQICTVSQESDEVLALSSR